MRGERNTFQQSIFHNSFRDQEVRHNPRQFFQAMKPYHTSGIAVSGRVHSISKLAI